MRRGAYVLRNFLVLALNDPNSLAADSLQKMGMLNATDIIGGYEAWKDAGLPVTNEPQRRRPRSLASLAGSVV